MYLYGDMIISSIHDICPDNYNYSRFTLMDKCRSEKWEVCLYGDMPVVLRQGIESSRAENCGGLRSCSSWCEGKAFLGRVHRYTARGSPAIRAGKGWRGRRELAPRCSATRIKMHACSGLDKHTSVIVMSAPPPPPPPPPGAGRRVVAEGLSSQLVRPLWGLTGETRSRPGVTVAGGPRGLQGQRDESDDGRHSLGSCCLEDLSVACRLLRESDPRPRGLPSPVQ